jgi:hypothetical protein
MKKMALAASALCFGIFASSVSAQSCSSPTTITSNNTVNGNTCGGDQSFTDICGGATLTGPSNVYTWTVSSATPTVSGSLTVTPTGATPTFDPGIAVTQGATCAAATGNCTGSADNAGSGAAEAITISSAANSAATYFLIVSSFSTTGANQCGPYSLAIGTLPVKLQSFQIN